MRWKYDYEDVSQRQRKRERERQRERERERQIHGPWRMGRGIPAEAASDREGVIIIQL
eukprot:SAG31_NODE_35251_length_325_cov_0.451327_1_plen_57_part_01